MTKDDEAFSQYWAIAHDKCGISEFVTNSAAISARNPIYKRSLYLSSIWRRAEMKKCMACAFSSTKKESRPKKCTTPEMACSIDCQADGGAGGGFWASNGGPAAAVELVSRTLNCHIYIHSTHSIQMHTDQHFHTSCLLEQDCSSYIQQLALPSRNSKLLAYEGVRRVQDLYVLLKKVDCTILQEPGNCLADRPPCLATV